MFKVMFKLTEVVLSLSLNISLVGGGRKEGREF